MPCMIVTQNIQRKCKSANYSHFQLFNHKPSIFNWFLSRLMSTWSVTCDLPCSHSCGTLRLNDEGWKNFLIRQTTLRLPHGPCSMPLRLSNISKMETATSKFSCEFYSFHHLRALRCLDALSVQVRSAYLRLSTLLKTPRVKDFRGAMDIEKGSAFPRAAISIISQLYFEYPIFLRMEGPETQSATPELWSELLTSRMKNAVLKKEIARENLCKPKRKINESYFCPLLHQGCR